MNVSICHSLNQLSRTEWDALVPADQPFLRYDFLNSLELTGCVSPKTGWEPHHFVVRDNDSKELIGVAPAYIKHHSYGEYVFDWQWADAYKATGQPYYPKLLMAVPFTPVTGERFFCAQNVDVDAFIAAVMTVAQQSVEALALSSIHCLFPPEAQRDVMQDNQWVAREAFQFHWENEGYSSFDDYLARMTSKRRKAVRRERRQVAEQGITFEHLTGSAITPDHWRIFNQFYRDTLQRYGAIAYLSAEFFEQMGELLADSVLLILAKQDGQPIAGALNLFGDKTLYGRYWGCSVDLNGLHFDTCYYQAIEFCIGRGLRRFEAGAQGEHKLDRGFLPNMTYSTHWFRHAGFFDAIKSYLSEEGPAMRRNSDNYMAHSPFKNSIEP